MLIPIESERTDGGGTIATAMVGVERSYLAIPTDRGAA